MPGFSAFGPTLLLIVILFCTQTLPDNSHLMEQNSTVKPDSSGDELKEHIFSNKKSVFSLDSSSISDRTDDNPPTPKMTAGHSDTRRHSLKNRIERNALANNLYRRVLYKKPTELLDSLDFYQSEEIFRIFEGKIIGSIRWKKVKIFSGSVHDTLWADESQLSNALNKVHIQTRQNILQGNLLFEVGQPLDAFVLADNERILRSLPYIEEADIFVKPRSTTPDTVDVIVVTKDIFSLGVSATVVTADRFRVAFFERNLLGSGTELRYTFFYNRTANSPIGHEVKYGIPNIKGTFISGFLRYANSFEGEHREINFEKQFLTPQTKWGGALNIDFGSALHEMLQDSTLQQISYTFDYQDFWVGHAFRIGGEKSRNNLVFSARFRNDNFKNRPFVSADSNQFFHDRKLYLGAITFRNLKYLQSNLILSFGEIEDIPVGYRAQVIAGWQEAEFGNRPYVGVELSSAQMIKNFGYLGVDLNAGGFYKNKDRHQGVVDIKLSYYTPLSHLGTYQMRNLFFVNWTHGVNRLPGEFIQLRNDIRSLSVNDLYGTSEMVIKLENVVFTPWTTMGFKFALYTFGDTGFLSSDSRLFDRQAFYSSFGIGCRIRNESLVIDTIQLRLSYFPRTPGDIDHWKLDLSSRYAYIFRNVQTARPEIIEYE